jgi:hypothetical protein
VAWRNDVGFFLGPRLTGYGAVSHPFLREIPQYGLTGQAAGVAGNTRCSRVRILRGQPVLQSASTNRRSR